MSRRRTRGLLVAALALASTACMETTGPSQNSTLATAFNSVLLGFNNTSNTFAGGTDGGLNAWMPAGGGRGGRGPGGGGPGAGGMCGGGLGGLFVGAGFGLDFGRGPHGGVLSGSCAFEAASGRVVCAAETVNGLTVNRSAQYTNAAGAVQQAFDSITTNSVNTRVSVSGTVTRRDSAVSSVQHSSDRTVSGLAASSAQRTVNGTLGGSRVHHRDQQHRRIHGRACDGRYDSHIVIPVSTTGISYPTSGTVTRSMSVTLTYTGQSPKQHRRAGK